MAAPQPSPISRRQEFVSGRFIIMGPLGHGGMGEVYRAEDTKLKRQVALKRLPADLRNDPAYREKLLREAERASALNCPNIAALYDVVEEGAEICLVMEYVEGSNLRQRLSQPMPLLSFLEVALQCTDALIAAHDRGIVHRDIKPENIMLTPSGRVKVLDFGLARQLPRTEGFEVKDGDSTISTVEMIAGTAGYMSPETLLSRPIDARTDLFSLGVVFYEALTGRHPFRDTTFMATADRVLHAEPPKASSLNPQIPPAFDLVIERMIAKSAEDRYATAQELRTALFNVRQHIASGEWRPPLLTPRRRRVLSGMTIILVLGASLAWSGPRWFGKLGFLSGANAASLPQPMRVAVLPFRSIEGDGEKQAYARGLTETLTARLTQLTASRPLDVVSALEVHNRRIADVEQARTQLGANLVLEGSVHYAGPDVRVNFALLDSRTKRQLRAQTLTSAMQAGFALEDQLSDVVAHMLDVELTSEERVAASPGDVNATARELYLRGRGYLQDFDKPRQLDRAKASFDAAIAADGNFAAAYAGLGTVYWHEYNLSHDASLVERARLACGRAIALEGSSPEAHECLGRLYNGTGQYEDAIAELSRVLEKDPTNDGAIRLLARAYESLQKSDEAEQTYLRAIKLRPQYWAGYSALGGMYFGRARYENAARMFTKAIELAPDNVRGYFNLAGVKIEQRKYAEAIELLEKSIAIQPSATAYANRGTAQAYLKDWDRAAGDYEKAISLGGEDYELWGLLAESFYWSTKRRPEAKAAYEHAIMLTEQAVRVNPRDGELRAELAKYCAMAGQQQKAADGIAQALRLSPKKPKVYFIAAVVERQAGHKDRALAWLAKAVQAGYSPASVQDDPIFASLHSEPGFLKSISHR